MTLFVATVSGAPVKHSLRPVPGQYIASFKPGVGAELVSTHIVAAHGAKLLQIYTHGFQGFAFAAPAPVAQAIADDSSVLLVEEDAYAQLLQVAPQSPPGWGLDRIDQALLPLDHIGSPGCVTGTNIRIYILDSGVTDPLGAEFGGRLVDLYTWDPGHFRDGLGHGTAVASIAGGTNYGMGRGATIVNVRVVDNVGGAQVSTIVAGINAINADHAANNTRPGVVNMSLLVGGGNTQLDNAVLQSINASGGGVGSNGLTYVVGAGNGSATGSMDACAAGSPARLGLPFSTYNPNAYSTITVGATMLRGPETPGRNYDLDERAERPEEASPWWSNTGQCVDLFAPGSLVDALDYVAGGRIAFSGTSSATPYVTGAVARVLQAYPWMTSIDVETNIKQTATQNVIGNVGTGSPNLLLRTGYFRCRPGYLPQPIN